ncbi:MAG TPA: DUF5985 family protein [Blastocatellia bacterium]|nr:DUF5985 family protein [Blastocatellia bacterium]
MSGLIYGLCALTALLCAWLLLWSGLCFAGLTLNNLILIADKLIFPEVDLSVWRLMLALISMMVLLYGLIWNAE